MKPDLIDHTLRGAPSALLLLLVGAMLSPAAVSGLHAQPVNASAATGTITGRIYNPATGEFVRNAEVAVAGTALTTFSGDGGTFTLAGVPAGEAVITVRYTGYTADPARVSVGPGATATVDITIVNSLAPRGAADTIRLAEFSVSAEREGNAKAIMEQRRNLNISTSVASDVFGDVAQGNVGEFLKYLPGVDIEYNSGIARSPILGGLDPQYVGVAIDGVKLASADAFVAYGNTENGTAGGQSRSVGFEAMVLSGIESIEISRTLSADMDADAPAGRINLKTKRAFDRKGRRITYQVGVGINSEDFTLERTSGFEDGKSRKVTPNTQFGYSETFLGDRLGVLFNFSQARNYSRADSILHTYHRAAPTAADPRPLVLTRISFGGGSSLISNLGGTLTLDYRFSPRFNVGLGVILNTYEDRFRQPVVLFNAATANTAAGTGRQTVSGDGLTSFRTNGGGSVEYSGGNQSKNTNTVTYTPQFEYTVGPLQVKGLLSYSRSKNDYESLERGFARTTVTNVLPADWRASRPSATAYQWTLEQLSGADWSDLANYRNPRLTNEGRSVFDELYNAQIDTRTRLGFGPATFLKFGGKVNEQRRESDNLVPYYLWAYNGPEGGPTGSWAFVKSPRRFELGSLGAPTAARLPAFPNNETIAQLIRDRPDLFTNVATAENYYQAFVQNRRDMRQFVTAAYGLGETQLGKVQLQGGLRWEETVTQSKEWDPRSAAEVGAAGFPVSATTRRATTIPGIQYQFLSKPRTTREGDYNNWFPSLSAKYNLSRAWAFQAGYNRAISRPPINALAGVWSVDDVNRIVNAPNPNLGPEVSDNVVARLAYYFEPVGSLTFQVAQNSITDFRVTEEFTATEFGYGNDPELSSYTFISTTNASNETVRFRSMEFGYNQALSFLPGILQGTNVNVAYTRLYSNGRRPGRVPHRASANISWAYQRYSLRVGAVWSDATPWTSVYGRWKPAETKIDLSGGYRLSPRANLFFQVRNITNQRLIVHEGWIEGEAGANYRTSNYGALWQFGVKGEF
jgi:iron complex outermembrane receptor protein